MTFTTNAFRSRNSVYMASSSRTQTKPSSNPSGKVRVVARIRGFRDPELASSLAVTSVHKAGDGEHSEKVTLSFNDQTSSRKHEYEVDYCYHQNEDASVMFSKEIKPQIAKVFDGENSTFIAFGARGSGKTCTIQGCEENPGLGMLAMAEILKIVGERHAVAVSVYEVLHNHVYDALDSKNPEVHVLEGAQGKIMLKGLSKVRVKTILEFQKLYFSGDTSNKSTQKMTLELPRRSHKALMIHILACNEGGKSKCIGKMNFVDLAGYENARRNSSEGSSFIEGTQINKSLNAFLNVIHAVNANETRVPYRESKLARVLQDCLGGNNHISMIVCLNPFFCPDSIHAVTLASRLKNVKPVSVLSSSVKKFSNTVIQLSTNKTSGLSVFSTTKSQTNSRLPLSAKKTNVVLKGRNLFDGTEEANGITEKLSSMENNHSNVVKSDISSGGSILPYVKEENNPSNVIKSDISSGGSILVPYVKEENNPSNVVKSDISGDAKEENNPSNVVKSDISSGGSIIVPYVKEDVLQIPSNFTEPVHHFNGDNIKKNLPANERQSLSLTTRLIKLREELRPLCSPTPLPVSVSRPLDLEPKTPVTTHKLEFSNCHSGTFSKHNSGMQQSLVQDYLQFLNSATKDDLKGLPGIGEKRATYILELREVSPEPFKCLDDLEEIGLSAKQVKTMMKKAAANLFS
ncbi:kinesin-like protein KIN-10C [Bidens hawaiensis]|uniref:kinesin-like protein KIN-10C n=1 Tax=Bidens hawaiensis TaxID=980011 RepID=UPI0040493705